MAMLPSQCHRLQRRSYVRLASPAEHDGCRELDRVAHRTGSALRWWVETFLAGPVSSNLNYVADHRRRWPKSLVHDANAATGPHRVLRPGHRHRLDLAEDGRWRAAGSAMSSALAAGDFPRVPWARDTTKLLTRSLAWGKMRQAYRAERAHICIQAHIHERFRLRLSCD